MIALDQPRRDLTGCNILVTNDVPTNLDVPVQTLRRAVKRSRRFLSILVGREIHFLNLKDAEFRDFRRRRLRLAPQVPLG